MIESGSFQQVKQERHLTKQEPSVYLEVPEIKGDGDVSCISVSETITHEPQGFSLLIRKNHFALLTNDRLYIGVGKFNETHFSLCEPDYTFPLVELPPAIKMSRRKNGDNLVKVILEKTGSFPILVSHQQTNSIFGFNLNGITNPSFLSDNTFDAIGVASQGSASLRLACIAAEMANSQRRNLKKMTPADIAASIITPQLVGKKRHGQIHVSFLYPEEIVTTAVRQEIRTQLSGSK